LGGTLVGWFVTGGIGLNAYGRGRALDGVRAADVLLPAGEHVRFHDDGRLDVPDEGHRRKTIAAAESAEWFRDHDYEPMTLADLAGSEGVLGLVLQIIVTLEPRPEIGAFLLSFASEGDALAAAEWVDRMAGAAFGPPGNVKFLSRSHLDLVRKVWRDEDAREWHGAPGALTSGAQMPWARIFGPADFEVSCGADRAEGGAYLFVDFLNLDFARSFVSSLHECPGRPTVLEESVRFASERFRPQQTKRLGPGLIAAEIVMPTREVKTFLPSAETVAHNVGAEIDAEVYFLADDEALVIAATLVDHRRASYLVDLSLAPVLLDLAMNAHSARPYVLGRWQAAYMQRKFGRSAAARIRGLKRSLDPAAVVNRGVLLGLRLQGPLGALLGPSFASGIGMLRAIYGTPALAWGARLARGALAGLPGPARGRGAPAALGAKFRASAPVDPAALGVALPHESENGAPRQSASDRAVHCVNCGECNSVCPIFHESKIRLPQMLTHIGEAMRGGEAVPLAGSALLDLCMRCGNCEEVCQAGIPHLPLYEEMQAASDRARPPDRERHAAIVLAVRGSQGYLRDFLNVRPGGYLKRSPASLPGVTRYVVLRAEQDAGPAASCIHCGACVSVCPTHANRELEGNDPRWITTEQERCIGCGTCVEVCPANLSNGGQTLRVLEAPTPDWFTALEEFEMKEPS
jgi:ferredoxin